METIKLIRVQENDWEKLMELKMGSRIKNLSELIHLILIHTEEAIFRGDFSIIKTPEKEPEIKIAIEEVIKENFVQENENGKE